MEKLFLAISVAFLAYDACFVAATCNVETPGIALENVFNLETFDAANQALLEIIPPAQALGNVSVRIVEKDEDGHGGTAATFWFLERQRLSDGFVATFEFSIDGKTDGFAFVAQNDKIQDIQGSIGDNLGFRDGLNSYIAAGFDVCNDRASNPSLACNNEVVVIATQGVFPEPAQTLATSSSLLFSIKDGDIHTGRVAYLGDIQTVKVYIDDVLITQAVTDSLESLWGGRFAYFGFTASNLFNEAANIDIHSFRIDQLLSDSKIVTGLKKQVDFGTRHLMKLSIRDSCDTQVPYSTIKDILSAENITATLTFANNDDIVLIAKIFDQVDGSFELAFDIPQNLVGSWNLDVSVNGIQAQAMPFNDAIESKIPNPGGLSTQNLILICSLAAVLLITMAYIIQRLWRYRQKLKENEEDINYGKVKREIDGLEKDIEYSMNPLMGNIEDMKERLAHNEAILNGLRSGQAMLNDSNYTIEQLMEENEKLRNEMNRLKKEEQEREALSGGVSKMNRLLGTSNRKEFEQEKA